MPDWTYQTLFRPALMSLGVERGRAIALGAMGALARTPGGRRVIQLMGHMAPDARLRVERDGLEFASRVGLGHRLDPGCIATAAFAEFGFGFLEVGPATAATASAIVSALGTRGGFFQPVFVRMAPGAAEEMQELAIRLASRVAGFVVPVDHLEIARRGLQGAIDAPRIYAAIPVGNSLDRRQRACCEAAIRDGWLAGVVVDEVAAGVAIPTANAGEERRDAVIAAVRQLRQTHGPGLTIIAATSAESPAEALDLLEAGADLVTVDRAMINAGPGLPKRINEALLYAVLEGGQPLEAGASNPSNAIAPEPARVTTQAWFWAFLMGLSMFVGGVAAMMIAATRVVLPYDEAMADMTRAELMAVNDRLLPFMRHDRVTLAGTMLAVGLLYMTLARWGVRRGVHWAYLAVVVSALAGFLSFFSFLGFGYFDPFHAFVTAILFQFLLAMAIARLPARHGLEPPGLHNDWRWRANQWGQLLFVVQGAALITAGVIISYVGMTTIFVVEDLEFMQTTREALVGAHPSLAPLVAHDRATFGGMLIACGAVTLLPALWGFGRGQHWLWWSLMLAGTFAYCVTMQVHWAVGYHDPRHLLPAVAGLALLWAGGGASYAYLAGADPDLELEWRRRLAAKGVAHGRN